MSISHKVCWTQILIFVILITTIELLMTVHCVPGPVPVPVPPVSNKAAVQSRNFPFCVDEFVLDEYKLNLADGPLFKPYITNTDKDNKFGNYIQSRPRSILPCLTCGNELIHGVELFRIFVDAPLEGDAPVIGSPSAKTHHNLKNSLYRNLRQWFHVHITTLQPVEGLLVQSIAGYQNLPHGQFNTEFACNDCGFPSGDLEKNDVLELYGKAAVIPCKRRAYEHARHPNVYIYASKGNAASSFHFHFNFLDLPCRDMKLFQFMILAVVKFETNPKSKHFNLPHAQYVYTNAINHNFQDSPDGAPYPYHVSFNKLFKCHVPDESLPGAAPLNFQMAPNGDLEAIRMNPEYDSCLMDTTSAYKEDAKIWLSDLICRNPPRTRCDYNDLNKNSVVDHKCHADPGKACVCHECTTDVNDFTQAVLPKVIRRGYMARRFHGIAMIIGTVSASIVSIHVARYFKEDGGGCILVGWWFWIHASLSYISHGAVWAGFVIGLTAHERPSTHYELELLSTKRAELNHIHKIIGSLAVVFFHANFWMGPGRSGKCQMVMICYHCIVGYLTVALGILATFVSVACREEKVFLIVMVIVSVIPWILGCVFQIIADSVSRLIPRRKYIPVIESVRVSKDMPKKIPRLVVVGVLILFTFILTAASSLLGGYNGIGMFGHCKNCIWKYDDMVVLSKNASYTDYALFHGLFKCTKIEEYDSGDFFF